MKFHPAANLRLITIQTPTYRDVISHQSAYGDLWTNSSLSFWKRSLSSGCAAGPGGLRSGLKTGINIKSFLSAWIRYLKLPEQKRIMFECLKNKSATSCRSLQRHYPSSSVSFSRPVSVKTANSKMSGWRCGSAAAMPAAIVLHHSHSFFFFNTLRR